MAWRWNRERRRSEERPELERTSVLRTHGRESINPVPGEPRLRTEPRGGLVRGDNPVMLDGQYASNIDRGPEKMNPEGSVDIPNGDYRER